MGERLNGVLRVVSLELFSSSSEFGALFCQYSDLASSVGKYRAPCIQAAISSIVGS